MTDLPAVGTIVRITDHYSYSTPLAVVVPLDYDPNGPFGSYSTGVCTRLIEDDLRIESKVWYVGDEDYQFDIVPDDEVPDDILALAGRCLLDPNFIPFSN